jgi:RNA polymerase sigma factor (sigma-70 family)
VAEINWALREDPATICLLEDAGNKIHDCCQITTFGRNLIHPEHIGEYLYFFPYADFPGKYYGEKTIVREKVQEKNIQPDYSYAVMIDSQVEFQVNRSALRMLSQKYMPVWHSSSYARFLSGKTSAVLQFVRIYKTDGQPPDSISFEKGRLGSYQVFKLYDAEENDANIPVNVTEPLISDNRFNYLKDEIIHDLKVDGSFIAEYDSTESGKKALRDRISVEQALSGRYKGLHQSWTDKREQWNEGNFDEFPEDFDMAQLDYDAIYDEVIRVCPSMKSMIEYVRNIKAARKGEYDYLLKDVHENNEKAQESAERIFDMSLRNAVKAALQAYKQDGLDLEDAFQEACIGIWTAIWKHHDDVQVLFPTYCSRWIMQNMQRYLPYFQPNCKMPAHYVEYTRGIVKELKAAVKNIDFNSLQPEQLKEMLLKYTSCDEEDAKRLSFLLIPPLSFDDVLSHCDEEELSDHCALLKKIDEEYFFNDRLPKWFSKLRPREEDILRLRCGLNDGHEYTLEEIGRKYDLTRERIRQIEDKALRHLRNLIPADVYADYGLKKPIQDEKRRGKPRKREENAES